MCVLNLIYSIILDYNKLEVIYLYKFFNELSDQSDIIFNTVIEHEYTQYINVQRQSTNHMYKNVDCFHLFDVLLFFCLLFVFSLHAVDRYDKTLSDMILKLQWHLFNRFCNF